jgi:hypothetical protein
MAFDPSSDPAYTGKITAPSTEFPYGKAQNITVAGDNTGTPSRANLINDVWGFFAALLDAAGLTASGTPDEVGASQYLEAINALITAGGGSQAETIYPVGSIYVSTLATNPATLLGFGTWAVFGAGRTPVGIDSGDVDYDTLEETGGSKTISKDGWGSTQVGGQLPEPTTDGRLITGSGLSEAVENLESIAEAANDLSNVSPYIVISMWKRTA